MSRALPIEASWMGREAQFAYVRLTSAPVVGGVAPSSPLAERGGPRRTQRTHLRPCSPPNSRPSLACCAAKKEILPRECRPTCSESFLLSALAVEGSRDSVSVWAGVETLGGAIGERLGRSDPRTPGLNFEPRLAVFADAAKKGEQTFYSQESKGARRRRVDHDGRGVRIFGRA
jgi:hypothetical protein